MFELEGERNVFCVLLLGGAGSRQTDRQTDGKYVMSEVAVFIRSRS